MNLVRQHVKIQPLGHAKLRILFHAVDAHAHDLRVQFSIRIQIPLKRSSLQRTAGRKRPGIKIKNGPFAAFGEGVEGHQLVATVAEGKSRRRGAQRQGLRGGATRGGDRREDGGTSVGQKRASGRVGDVARRRRVGAAEAAIGEGEQRQRNPRGHLRGEEGVKMHFGGERGENEGSV